MSSSASIRRFCRAGRARFSLFHPGRDRESGIRVRLDPLGSKRAELRYLHCFAPRVPTRLGLV